MRACSQFLELDQNHTHSHKPETTDGIIDNLTRYPSTSTFSRFLSFVFRLDRNYRHFLSPDPILFATVICAASFFEMWKRQATRFREPWRCILDRKCWSPRSWSAASSSSSPTRLSTMSAPSRSQKASLNTLTSDESWSESKGTPKK